MGALVGGEAFRMELEALDIELLVADAHDFLLVRRERWRRSGGYDKIAVQPGGIDDQGVIAHRLEGITQTGENTPAVMIDQRGLAVHAALGPDDLAAEHLGNALVAQTNAQDGDLAGPEADDFVAVVGLLGSAGAGRDNEVAGTELFEVATANSIVAENLDRRLTGQNRNRLDEVVGERIVIINNHHAFHPS